MKKKLFCLLLITISIISLSTIISNAFMFTPPIMPAHTPNPNPTTTPTASTQSDLEAQVAKLEA